MSYSPEDLNIIGSLPFFRGLATTDIAAILAEGRMRKVPDGGYFFQQEDPADHVYLLAKGQVKLLQVTPEGQQVIHNVIAPWTVFGLIAFTHGGLYPVSALAAADCQAISWEHTVLSRLAERFPKLSLNAMGQMAQRLQEFQGQIRTLSTERVERRLARVLLRLVRQVGRKTEAGVLIDLPVTRQDLAEMSGTTLYTVSRILSQWERQGLVDSGRERVVILKPHGLVMIAEDIPGESTSQVPTQ